MNHQLSNLNPETCTYTLHPQTLIRNLTPYTLTPYPSTLEP